MIRGKELAYRVKYPYTVNELLIQVRESFSEQHFLPLEERQSLIRKIDSLRNVVTNSSHIELKYEHREASQYSYIVSIISLVISIIIGFIGVYSLISKLRKEEKHKIMSGIEKTKDEIEENTKSGIKFEQFVISNIQALTREFPTSVLYPGSGRDYGIDFELHLRNDKYYGIIKYLFKRSLSSNVIIGLQKIIMENNVNGLIITNKYIGLAAMAEVKAFNQKNYKNKIVVIDTDLEKRIFELFQNSNIT